MTSKLPTETVFEPVYVFVPVRINVPMPALLRSAVPLITPPTCRVVLALVRLQVWLEPSAMGKLIMSVPLVAVMSVVIPPAFRVMLFPVIV